MKAIVTLSLSGTEFRFEDDACAKLRRYIEAYEAAFPAERRALKREELERILASRLAPRLRGDKTTLTDADVEAILVLLPAVGAPGSGMPARRRLFRIQQGRDVAGVCLGLAAYAQLDVSLVRTMFVLLVGVFGIVYIIAMFLVPVVETVEQAKLVSASP
jgi:phage shock protein PspC (stress-responsive transcriptional regulator)